MKVPALTNISSSRGAQMGRHGFCPGDFDGTVYYLNVPLVQGYDSGGAYWGSPDDLWRAWAPASDFYDEVDFFFRCENNHEAVTNHLREVMPDCKPVFAGLQPEDVAIGFFTALEWANGYDEDIGLQGDENPDDETSAKVIEACAKFIEVAGSRGLIAGWVDAALFGYYLCLDFLGCGTGFRDEGDDALATLVHEVLGYGEQIELYVNEGQHTYHIHGSMLK